MIIESVLINNYRCLKDVCIQFDTLVALLGRNGAGKSSILHAIGVFYDISAPITEEDFYNCDTSLDIEITVTYGRLREDETAEFGSYVSNDTLTVTKMFSMQDGGASQMYYSAFPQYPRFARIRSTPGAMPKREAWEEFVDSGEFPDLERARSETDVLDKMAAFEGEHPDLLEPIAREEQFFGPPNIGGGKLDNYTKFLLIPAVKDVTDEFSERRGSSLYQLLDVIVHRKIETREDIADRRSEIERQVKDLFDPANLPELREVGDDISQLLQRFFPGAGLILDWDEVRVPDLPLPTARSKLIEDGFEGDIDKKGHGLQRALLITLLQYLAQLHIPSENDLAGDDGSDEDTAEHPQPIRIEPSLILAIEEPELYLHPLRCKYLSNLFSELTLVDEDNPTFRNQIIFSSHSPHFVDLQRFDNIRILRKMKTEETPVAFTVSNSFPIEIAMGRLAEVAKLDPDNVTEESFKSRIVPVMSSMANEGFFADLVVMVEGFGDAGILMRLQEILNRNWLTLGVAVIPIEGKTKLDRPVLIFQGLGIPVYLIFDGDIGNKGGDQEATTIKTNHLLQRLVDAPEEDFPVSKVNSTWAIFERDIEHELKQALGEENFNQIRDSIANEFAMNRPSQVTKRFYCATRFIDETYGRGHSVPILENIVEAITNLATANQI